MSEIRKDPITNQWIIIAPERKHRPVIFHGEPDRQKGPDFLETCPFCPGNEAATQPAIYTTPESEQWQVRVFANQYPALTVETHLQKYPVDIYDSMTGTGAHEIIIQTPKHNQHYAEFSLEQLGSLLRSYQVRLQDLKKDTRLLYLQIFSNKGLEAGATQEHSHAQLLATPIIPPQIQREQDNMHYHFQTKERCLICDIIHYEKQNKERLVAQNESFLALIPYAAKSPFALKIYPQEHIFDYTKLNFAQIRDLAQILQTSFKKIKKALNDPPYNFLLKTVPNTYAQFTHDRWPNLEKSFHWYMEILPKLNYAGGMELATDMDINPSSPEECAGFLQQIDI